MKRKILGLAIILTLSVGSPAGAYARLINRIVETIDGDPVTLYELNKYRRDSPHLAAMPEINEAALLDALTTELIIRKEITAQGIVVSEEDVDRYIDGIRQRNRLTEEQLLAALEQQGLSWEAYRNQVKTDLEKVQLLNREIRGKVNITPEDVERYYEAHRDEYSTPAQVTVSQIMLRTSQDPPGPDEKISLTSRAQDLYQKLEDGADFAELARAYSEGPAAEGGGLLGTFKEGEMLEVFARTVEKLEPGEFSEPVWTEMGVHIIRLDERIGTGHQPLQSLAEEIKEQLYNAALEERYERWFREDLRKRYHVEILP